MTEEQIKQNANEYATKHEACHGGFPNFRNAFLAGAHSRDEEIKELEQALSVAGDALDMQREKIDKLCNPWVSVDERLPENNCVVFVSLDGTEYLSAHYRVASKRFITVSKDKQALVEVRKSSATYTVCGDCIKEEHFYSEGQREDITSLVTHWMPIPSYK